MDIQLKQTFRTSITRGCVIKTDCDTYLVTYFEGNEAVVSLESNQIFKAPSYQSIKEFIEENLDEQIQRVIQPENILLKEVD